MTLEEIPVVVIDFSGNRKFIVVELKLGDVSKTVLRTGNPYGLHETIFRQFQHQLIGSEIEARCLGGGKISVNLEQKTVLLHDESMRYGPERNRQETVLLIQTTYLEFKVEAR